MPKTELYFDMKAKTQKYVLVLTTSMCMSRK